ncbi:MAG: SUMF1/EgtB/PvdO family nonheme iron enzyme [Bacteroidota bacterium]
MKFFVKDDVCREMRLCNFSRLPVAPLLAAVLSMFSFGHVNAQSVYVKMGKGWSYITGAQRAVNDSNRVNYIMGNPAGGESQLLGLGVDPNAWKKISPEWSINLAHLGHRVNNFNEMDDYYPHDSEFMKAQIKASQVYEASKMVEGEPSFFISKTEVTNAEYRKFVEFCINEWMKENRPEIVQKYKWTSAEYVQAVQAWLESGSVSSAAAGDQSSSSLLSPAKTWAELYLRNLDWKKIEYKGKSIFPNTQVWNTDFPMSYNQPMRDYYFVHPAYDNYPVVGVSKDQANHYCLWYTDQFGKQEKYLIQYRLPSEIEWERAASVVAEKRSKKSSGSPVNNNFMRNAKGVYIANFRPQFNDFGADGALYPTPVHSYFINDAGCYNMQGNVAEWTSTEIDYRVGEYTEEGHIIKGGAWNLPAAACTIGSRGIVYYGVAGEEPATSYVGFRMVAVPMKKFRPLITPEF